MRWPHATTDTHKPHGYWADLERQGKRQEAISLHALNVDQGWSSFTKQTSLMLRRERREEDWMQWPPLSPHIISEICCAKSWINMSLSNIKLHLVSLHYSNSQTPKYPCSRKIFNLKPEGLRWNSLFWSNISTYTETMWVKHTFSGLSYANTFYIPLYMYSRHFSLFLNQSLCFWSDFWNWFK